MNEEAKKIVNKKTKNKLDLPTLILITIAIIGWTIPLVGSFNYVYLKHENTKLHQNIDVCSKEIVVLKDRLDGIKDNEDLLRRDIFLYIDRKFQSIPKTLATDIALQIVDKSKNENVPPELIMGIIEVESKFNPMSISSKNARGLMQVMPEWANKFNLQKISDLHDVDTNIDCGIKVLKIHIDEENGNITKGLYKYVGRSDSYSSNVYAAMGRFVAFRSTIDDNEEIEIETQEQQPDDNQSPINEQQTEGADNE